MTRTILRWASVSALVTLSAVMGLSLWQDRNQGEEYRADVTTGDMDSDTTIHRRLSLLGDGAGGQKNQPILVMGMPRSGSLAIHEFFKCNEYRSAHYCCGGSDKTHFSCGSNVPTCGACVHENMRKERPPMEGCGDYQVYSQFDVETGDPYAWFLPQHFTMPLLHEVYPESTWILNTRETPERWAENVLHWFSVTNRIFNSFDISYYSEPMNITVAPQTKLGGAALYKELAKSLERAKDEQEHARRHRELVRVYQAHTEKVRQFVRDYPTHKLIEVNVDDVETTGRVLAEAFGGLKASCYQFDSKALDDDWKDFRLKV